MNFVPYALYVAANMAAILWVPNNVANQFLAAYSTASLVIGVIVVYLFGQSFVGAWFHRSKIGIGVGLCAMITIGVFAGNPVVQAICYALTLLLGDYVISQGCSNRKIVFYRLTMAASVLPGFFGPSLFSENLIMIRVVLGFLFLIFYGFFIVDLRPLKIRNAGFYVLATSALYYGLLMLISFGSTGSSLKGWYVGSQIGLGLQLKLMDFEIRMASRTKSLLPTLIYTATILFPLALYYLYSDARNILFYYCSVAGLFLVIRFTRKV